MRWGSEGDLARSGGLVVGRSRSKGLLRADLPGHFLTIAPTRSGKGVGSIIPNLLTYPGSVVVLDPKGENYAITACARRELGQRVHAFDPFGIAAAPYELASLNPLELLDVNDSNPMIADDAALLADLLVQRGIAVDPFWNIEAAALLGGLAAYVGSEAGPQTLG